MIQCPAFPGASGNRFPKEQTRISGELWVKTQTWMSWTRPATLQPQFPCRHSGDAEGRPVPIGAQQTETQKGGWQWPCREAFHPALRPHPSPWRAGGGPGGQVRGHLWESGWAGVPCGAGPRGHGPGCRRRRSLWFSVFVLCLATRWQHSCRKELASEGRGRPTHRPLPPAPCPQASPESPSPSPQPCASLPG